MAGIYIHVPFCRHKCNYCNFYSLASTRYLDQVASAIISELNQRRDYLAGQNVETIYFGGGTPSILSTEIIELILQAVFSGYTITNGVEITLEANPDDLSPEKLVNLKKAGINRLSIGIQSFRQEDLKFLGRTHSSSQVKKCILDSQKAGFDNLSIDLIYGIPTLTEQEWEENLKRAFDLDIPHISAYSLTVVEKTPLEFLIRKGKMKPVDEDLSLSHYRTLCRMMSEHGYEHYEISNFCLPDEYSRHNTAYWQGKHYLGIGPSAHSYNGDSRSWNVANLTSYIASVQAGKVESEKEILSKVTQLNEYIMTSLRTQWGCDLNIIRSNFGEMNATLLLEKANHFLESNQMICQSEKLILTPEGRLFADGIAATLFEEE